MAISKVLKNYCLSYYYRNSDESLVLNQTARFFRSKLLLIFVFLAPIFISSGRIFFYSSLIKISEVKNYSIDEKRDIFSTFDEEGQKDQGLPIDPFDLMNRLKQVGAMNDATTPTDALDEAINAFDQSESAEYVPIK